VATAFLSVAGCGGERCVHDTCEPGSEVDAVVAVPDTVVTGDMVLVNDADGVAGDAERDDALADTGSDTMVQDVADDVACGGETPYLLDGKCLECLNDSDCLRSGFTGVCLGDGTCQPDPDCQGKCTKDFPYCVWVGGAAQCVQCVDDEDCALAGFPDCTCTGDPVYACMDPTDGAACWYPPDSCPATCSDTMDCAPGPGDTVQDCVRQPDDEYGFCVEPSGHCDGGVTNCCGPHQSCYSLTAMLAAILGPQPLAGRLIEPPAYLFNYCACETADDCLAGGPCTDTAIICDGSQAALGEYYDMLCPDGQLDSRFPDKLCVQPATLQEFFGITGT